jgi:hypothetical protein
LDFAHPVRKRITNFGDAKKNLENMQLSRDDADGGDPAPARSGSRWWRASKVQSGRGSQLVADGERSAAKTSPRRID